ncbi:MAG: His/Gly/Thr/Pro-type tRNA ligase C-terminal domain-containing protein [Candidatus Aenigmatarchaeota archaeon]
MSTIINLGKKVTDKFDVKFINKKNQKTTPYLGNYVINPERVIYAIVKSNRKKVNGRETIKWPDGLEPYKFGIIGAYDSKFPRKIYKDISNKQEIFYDNTSDNLSVKIARIYSLGIPRFTIIRNEERKKGEVEVEETFTGKKNKIKVEKLKERYNN